MIRLVHISDIHVSAPELDWQLRDYVGKRIAGYINHRYLGRRFRFRHAERVLRILFDELRARKPDRVIFSGDATALGFESELRKACELLGVHDEEMPPGLAVPGNHDYATRFAAASGLFERYFSRWQTGERVCTEIYPFAQRAGDCWLIGLNSSSGNRWPWDASGRAGPAQVERLRRLLAHLDEGPRILITHYPICLANGRKENPWRSLRDLKSLMRVAIDGGVNLWLHGHRHKGYFLPSSKHAPFPVICAGSSTQTGIWSYCEYELDSYTCRATRRVFNKRSGRFENVQTFEVPLANMAIS
jgi:3',5'-cyclic AMP phosphodiesterase CpdA